MMNSGSEMTASEVTEMAWSDGRPARTPARMPNTSASGTMMSAVIPARMNELTIFGRIRSQIGDSPPAA